MDQNIISDMGILSNISYETYGGTSRIFIGTEISSDKDEKYGSSGESVEIFRFRQLAKLMI